MKININVTAGKVKNIKKIAEIVSDIENAFVCDCVLNVNVDKQKEPHGCKTLTVKSPSISDIDFKKLSSQLRQCLLQKSNYL